jgi:hypothetical protein
MRKLLLAVLLLALPLFAQEPNYAEWNRILETYYDPARGMDYAGLAAKDAQALQTLRQQLGRANVAAMTPKQQLAYWINVYNVNVVATVVEKYPVDSIRDISTDPIVRLNVFKKERVPFGGQLLSLDDVEHKKIREVFKDPRIHFAINCAAKSCPPIRPEAYVGARVDAQLDEQAKRFLTGRFGARFSRDGDKVTMRVTKIMEWFGEDFTEGKVAFVKKYVSVPPSKEVTIEYDDYDWALNDWKR